jgi:hypothetical protein
LTDSTEATELRYTLNRDVDRIAFPRYVKGTVLRVRPMPCLDR